MLSFGLEPPDQLIIVLLVTPGVSEELEANAAWDGETGTYPCDPTDAEPTLYACKGPLIPLGSSVHIEVAAEAGKALIASGDFVLKALALPTVPAGAELPTAEGGSITPRPTRTLGASTPQPTTTPGAPAASPTPGSDTDTPYPNFGTPYPNP